MLGESGRRVLALLRDGPRQAHEIAGTLGIDTAAVRRHLEGLRAGGFVDRSTSVEGVGRPKMRYSLTEAGRETFPRSYGVLLEAVLASVRDAQGEAGLQTLLRDAAGRLAPKPERGASDAERLKRLMQFYNELGFEASLAKAGDKQLLTQRNCVVWKAAKADPKAVCVCLDEAMITGAVPGCKVKLLATMAEGAPECRHEIVLAKPGKRAS